jgi:CHAT domain-containing protein/tetratricopeptide (TPR) repeat protein
VSGITNSRIDVEVEVRAATSSGCCHERVMRTPKRGGDRLKRATCALLLATLPIVFGDCGATMRAVQDLLDAGRHDDAAAIARADIAVAEHRHGPSSLETADAIDELLATFRDDGARSFAEPEVGVLIERALAIRVAKQRAAADELLALRVFGVLHDYTLGRREVARQSLDELAAAARSADASAYVRLEIDALDVSFHATEYRLTDAGPLLRRALDELDHSRRDARLSARRALRLEARFHHFLGLALFQTGKPDGGRKEIGRALELGRRVDGNDSEFEHVVLDHLGLAYVDLGRYAEAAKVYEDWIARAQSSRETDGRALQFALQAYGGMLTGSGDYALARVKLEQGLAIEHRMASPRWFDRGAMLLNLGTCYAELDQPDRAIATFEEARIALAHDLDADHPAFGYVDLELGKALLRADAPDRAEVYFAASAKRMTAARVPGHLRPLIGLAQAAERQGHYEEAEHRYRAVLAEACANANEQRPDCATLHAGLATSLWGRHRLPDALAEAETAALIKQRALRAIAPQFAERRALAFRHALSPASDDLVAIAAAIGTSDAVDRAWRLVANAHNAVTGSVVHRQLAARVTRTPRTREAYARWKNANEAYVGALVTSMHDGVAADIIAARREAVEAAESALGRLDVESGRVFAGKDISIAQLRDALPPDSALVVYVEVSRDRPDAASNGGDAALHAFVLRAGDPDARLVTLGPKTAIDVGVRAWERELRRPSESNTRVDEAGAKVRQRIWDPLGIDVRQLFVLPSASLARVNFAALPGNDGRYLVEGGHAFHLLDDERDLLAAGAPAKSTRLVLIGAPDAEVSDRAGITDRPIGAMRSACAGVRSAALAPLPYARTELDDLGAIWREAKRSPPPVRLVGADADEAHARDALGGGGILHFATHGLYFGDTCTDAPASTRGIATVDTDAATPGALAGLSALVLSGSDKRAASADTDGLLTSDEIAMLDLHDTEWAVLSACETALGTSVPEEGVFGLRRAFRIAGSRTVIMSLWRVDDAATAEWMHELYAARLLGHASTIDAVHAADAHIIDQRRSQGRSIHPYYWAAFVAAGDWR